MRRRVRCIRQLFRTSLGATALEYSLLAAAIAAVVFAVVVLLGGQVVDLLCTPVEAWLGVGCP